VVIKLMIFAALAALSPSAQPGQPAPRSRPFRCRIPTCGPPFRALQGVGIDQNLNAQLPLDLTFRDELGRTVPLSTYSGSAARDSRSFTTAAHALHADTQRPGEQSQGCVVQSARSSM